MQRISLLVLFMAAFCAGIQAQKIGYINTEDVMQKMPEYATAQEEIDRISATWQAELEKKYARIEEMYQEYAAQEVLYTEEVKQKKQEAIFAAEREAKEYRENKFGYNGLLFSMQESKLRPIQEAIMRAVKTVAARRKYGMVFDKAAGTTWLYTSPTYDITEEVLKEMNLEEEETGSGEGTGGGLRD